MSPIPSACQGLANALAEHEAELADLQGQISGRDLPPNEPFPSSSQKAFLGQAINREREAVRKAKRSLDDCILVNTPPAPANTTPTLQITSMEVTQSVQRGANSIRLMRIRSTAVRVFVESGIDNGFDIGSGPNR